MRAVNPLPPSEVTSDKRPYEPSMEEILASIRRIIADDQSLPARGPASSASLGDAAVEDGESPQDDQIQDARLQDRSRDQRRGGVRPNERPAFRESPSEPARGAYSGASESISARGTAVPERLEQGVVPVEHPDHDVEEGDAFYETPVEPASVRAKPRETSTPRASVPPLRDEPRETAPLFSASTDTAVQSAFNMLAASRLANSSDEIMTMAREMIRPLLRTWIDDNLPAMVERMVRAEIERVSRGGR